MAVVGQSGTHYEDTRMEYIALIVAIIVVLWLYQRSSEHTTIYSYQRGLRYRQGRLEGVLEPGSYRYFKGRTQIAVLDMRPRYEIIAGQEIMSADNIGLKVSIAAQYRVADPLQAINNSVSYTEALHIELQMALRELAAANTMDELLAARSTLGQQILEALSMRAMALGLELISVNIRDIMLPGELKRVFSKEITARKEGLAALEKARGEQAALRNLANAAQLLENNPALLQLRLIQALSEGNHTLVLGQSPILPLAPQKTAEKGNQGQG